MKAEFDGAPQVPHPGTVAWLTHWVGHARPGAVMIAARPGDVTHALPAALADWVRALDAAGLIIAVWVDAGSDGARDWEWRVTRTGRDLPGCWPALAAPKGAAAVGVSAGQTRLNQHDRPPAWADAAARDAAHVAIVGPAALPARRPPAPIRMAPLPTVMMEDGELRHRAPRVFP